MPDPTREAVVEALNAIPRGEHDADAILAQPAMARVKAVVDAAVKYSEDGLPHQFAAILLAVDALTGDSDD